MAYPAGNGGLRSPREESFAFRNTAGTQMGASNDVRGQLHRRFTTNNIPTLSTPLSPIGQQRRQAAEPTEFTTATYHKLQVLEKKKLEYEYLKEQRRRFEAEMELIDLQSRRGEEEIHRLSTDLRFGKQPAHSQPTTPPEYNAGNGFPSAFSRPNRFSMSSINPGMTTPRGSRANSQVTSPPSSFFGNGGLPSQSVPGTRRNSDEDNDDFDNDFTPVSPVTRKNNRMSMPVTGLEIRGRDNLPDLASVLGHIDTTGYLFGEDDKEHNSAASPDHKAYLQMSNTDDKFPILVRRDGAGNGTKLSASSAALDLALSQSPGPDAQPNGWHGYRHRQAQQSLPTNTFRKGPQGDEYDKGQTNGSADVTPNKNMANNRRSVEFNLSPESKRSSFTSMTNGMPKLTQSYSASDVPTLKNGAGMNGANGTNGSGFNTHAEQHLHNHNANLGRIPFNAMNNRHSRDMSNGFKDQEYRHAYSALHASAAPFGPAITSSTPVNGVAGTVGSPAMSQYASTPAQNTPYYGYGMSMLNGAMNGLSMGPSPQMGGPPPYGANAMYSGGNTPYYNPYATYGPGGRVQDSQARVIQSRRLQNDANRFMNYDLKTMPRHEIYSLCKDQHGCRFLQKKLEERNAENIQIIFDETANHVVELMTDPFGNYLCQKLLEFCNDEQRNTLVRNASPAMVSIALNQHGTRALQKMIEFISTDEQTEMIIQALSGQVVDLIQDLNGNHVIQKCLNHLKSSEAQFIFDAVGEHCVIVGTHRHGCCVLQRCIDHASGFQKTDLVRKITAHSFNLVQDPFGNYVVQYILDLNDPKFTTPMCEGFQGKIVELSKQKFSSNVIEKCIRCAEMSAKAMMIEELLVNVEDLEQLMRDSYGNYVVQTALEFAPSEMCLSLIDMMRPILPSIRQTPYGRRIQSKVQEREGRLTAYTGRATSGHGSPHDGNATQPGAQNSMFANQTFGTPAYQPNGTSAYQAPMYTAAANYGANIASPQPHRTSNPPLPHQLHHSVQQAYQQYGVAPNGMGNFF
ncbi:ARM repeat-containing protein [Ophiobolus disseminans]|uniref:ARM repeat-containing protein n=1 Tax=Ophiobolus disseminans TaxID=1469910 RepID=A0A6A6ZZV7_9PLEO|nr:ARM repeat-containing protein [Ophiobolus disseminans]